MSKDALIQAFHDLEAFKWNAQEGFRLASGKTSPYYVDCRRTAVLYWLTPTPVTLWLNWPLIFSKPWIFI
jgi:hypothetical protein